MTRSLFKIALTSGASLLAAMSLAAPAAAQEPIANVFQRGITDRAPSVSRADLLACAQLEEAQIRNGADLDPETMAKMLHGTWARSLTWYGVPIENESALYFVFDGLNFEAMMYDQSNLGRGEMNSAIQKIRSERALAAKTPTMTFVDCDYAIVDKYYKVSDDVKLTNDVQFSRELRSNELAGLRTVWNNLVEQKFFDRQYSSEAVRLEVRGGTLSEITTPSVGGAYWTGSLKPAKLAGFTGTEIEMKGVYRGSHVGAAGEGQQVEFRGTERAQFLTEGGALVSSARKIGSSAIAAGELAEGWLTDCADFFDLPSAINWERVVIEPGV